MKNFLSVLNVIRLWPHCLLFFLFKRRIIDDLYANDRKQENIILKFLRLMTFYKPFRNCFYYRIGVYSFFIKWLASEYDTFIIGRYTPIGYGMNPVHAYATIINAKEIGRNFTIFQNVTVGNCSGDKNSIPTIGDDVTIFSNCVVVGNIKIGNNVKIGAGSIVLKSVPDNCTVVGNPARIIKQDGVSVNIQL